MGRKYSKGLLFFGGICLCSVLYGIRDLPKKAEFYLYEEDGKVSVYEEDGVTLYERTSIEVRELPEEIKTAVLEGKPVADQEELYSFLENYSS